MTQELPREVTKPVWDITPGYDFDPDVDFKELSSWFMDGTHSVPPFTPFFSWLWNKYCGHGMHYYCAVISLPCNKGWPIRTYHGHDYPGFYVVRDPEEIKRREVKFRERMRPYIEDYDGIWEKHKQELMALYKPLKEFDYEKAENYELFWILHDTIRAYIRQFEIHFLGMITAETAWLLLEQLCEEMFGINDQSAEFQKLMIGFDNEMFRSDRDLWQFAQDAMKAGLGDIFLTSEPKADVVIPKLEQTDAGRAWVKKLREWLDEHGWRSQRLAEINEPTWLEDPSPAIMYVKGYVEKGGGFDLEVTRQRLAEEREKAVAEIMARVPEDKKEWFLALIRLAQNAGSYSEGHTIYCEFYINALVRRCCLGIGRRLVQAGTIDKPEDTFYLIPDEIERVIDVPEYHKMQHLVNRRRKDWEEWCKETFEGRAPPVLTTRASLEEAVMQDLIPAFDPIAIKVVVGAMPNVRPELKADLYGVSGSQGVAEGTARVVMSYDDLGQVKPGDILVAPATYPSWTPVFARIRGAVVDRGGTLSHACIVGREFGIPVVINTFEGTRKIKNGMKIKVDGTEGTVYILEQ